MVEVFVMFVSAFVLSKTVFSDVFSCCFLRSFFSAQVLKFLVALGDSRYLCLECVHFAGGIQIRAFDLEGRFHILSCFSRSGTP